MEGRGVAGRDRVKREEPPAASKKGCCLRRGYSNPAAYQRFMDRWSAHLAPLFVHFVGIEDGQRVLEVGCGTGSLSSALLSIGETVHVPSGPVTDQNNASSDLPVHQSRLCARTEWTEAGRSRR
jgi:hypothetical protein